MAEVYRSYAPKKLETKETTTREIQEESTKEETIVKEEPTKEELPKEESAADAKKNPVTTEEPLTVIEQVAESSTAATKEN